MLYYLSQLVFDGGQKTREVIFQGRCNMSDVLIIGAGIVGCAIARKLSRYQLDVQVLEAADDVSMGATKANSAIVHGGYAEAHSKLKGRLCYKGRCQFAKLNEELHFGFSPIGSLVIAFDDSDLPKLNELLENGKKNGLTDLKILNHDEIMAMEPNINPEVKYALYCEGAGVTSPYEMAIALMENAIHNGVKLALNRRVTSIEKTEVGFRVTAENTARPCPVSDNPNLKPVDRGPDKEVYESRIVINCAGVQSGVISNMVGINDFTIHPRSGEYILFARGTGKAVNHVLFQMPSRMGKGILVTPTYHGNLLLGPDAIDEDRVNRATSAERLINIYRQAQHTTTHIDASRFIRSFAGVRAVSSTDDFIIEHSRVHGFIQCAGIQSPGMTSSPAIADMVCEIIDNDLIHLKEKDNFDPYRKPIIEKKELRPMSEIAPLVKLESGDERIVCRCEQVTEGTIKDAITREIPVTTIDGVKRRTRAGMGYCQGTFCRPRVKKLMEDTLGIPIDDGFDTEHSGINRVSKSEFVTFMEEEAKKQAEG